jgi:hypothetical protein
MVKLTSIQGLVAHLEAVLPWDPLSYMMFPTGPIEIYLLTVMHDLARNSPNLVGVKECAGNEKDTHYVDNRWTTIVRV